MCWVHLGEVAQALLHYDDRSPTSITHQRFVISRPLLEEALLLTVESGSVRALVRYIG